MTPDGIGCDFILDGSAGSGAAHTRVSRPSTAMAPATNSRCSTSKLERRNSLTCEVISTTSPKQAGAKKRAPASTSGIPNDAEGRRQIRRLNPERGFEQRPGAPIEEFKKAGIEDDAGGVALSPFDRELPAADKIGHESMIPKSGYRFSEKIMRNNKLK